MVANGQREAPIARVELKFEVGDNTFRETIIVMKNLKSPFNGLLFQQRNSTILDMRQRIVNFPSWMQLKNEYRLYSLAVEIILKPRKRTTVWVK